MEDNFLDKLKKAMMGQQAPIEIPMAPEQAPEVIEEAQTDAQTAQINEQAKSVNMMSKPELVQKEAQEQANLTVPGQLQERAIASEVKTPEQIVNEPSKDVMDIQSKLRENIKRYEGLVNKKSEKPQVTDKLQDAFASLHNILNYGSGSLQKNLATNNYEKQQAAKNQVNQGQLNNLQNLQNLYNQYQKSQTKDGISALDQAKLDQSERALKLKEKMAELTANTKTKTSKSTPTEGDKVMDREFGKKLNTWNTDGKADYEVNNKIFKDAIKDLQTGKVDTGFFSGVGARVPGVRTDTRELESTVRKAINGMLRSTLGSQFTEKEGERIFQQTFDPSADPELNIKNMQLELDKIEKRKNAIEDMATYYKKDNTISGYEAPKAKDESVVNEVKRRTKDGQVAVFDKNTKKFLRYE